ncbi:MAG: RagB/SusD family nutrient uptake outer membrane protein [Bacteroidales bacterium]|nr:RagB/SusD family nutrient uptake outer membrane protein [Bacteroidales bacterium]
MKKYIKLLFCPMALAVVMGSCSDWLEVKPSNQIAADEMFSKEEGFKSVLTGVYTNMTEASSYGRELTFGAMDYLAQYWVNPNQYSTYFAMATYDYKTSNAMNLVDPIWNNQYNSIANLNDMLSYIDVNKNVFLSEKTRSIIKGEALALRAFLHFDMLRAFAPHNFGTGKENTDKWLPYVEEYTKNTKESLSNTDFVGKVLQDIEAAAELLKNDPIYTGETLNDTYFANRVFHLNYYGVKALAARVYMYIGDKTKAAECALEVIEAQVNKGLFAWVNIDDVTHTNDAERDRLFASEHIFALNVRKLADNISAFVGLENTMNAIKLQKGKAIFESLTEYREKFVDNNDFCTKFNQPDGASSNSVNKFLRRMPMLRISEMYYILAECTGDISYLNTVRTHRGIVTELDASANFETELKKEYEKEFIGEGQFFFFNKRKGNLTINSKVGGYTLHMPQTEIDFGNRPRPTI